MESKSKKKTKKKAPAKRKSVTEKKVPQSMSGLCINCAPLGYTQVLAMLLVSVFSLVTILSMSSYKIDQQNAQLSAQSAQIESLR